MYNAKELALEVCNVGEAKIGKKSWIIFLSSIIAGLFIGLGYYGYIILSSSSAALPALGKFLGSFIFSVGLVMILIAGGDLFTGNCLVSMGAFQKRYSYVRVFKNLGIVYLGNLIGGLLLFSFIYFSKVDSAYAEYIIKISTAKTDLTFVQALLRGILGNILVSIAVYMSYASKAVPGKILASMLPVTLFVISGYEHSVANMFLLPLGKSLGGDFGMIDIIVKNLIPVTIGNFIGGAVMIPGIYYFIFLHDKSKKDS